MVVDGIGGGEGGEYWCESLMGVDYFSLFCIKSYRVFLFLFFILFVTGLTKCTKRPYYVWLIEILINSLLEACN